MHAAQTLIGVTICEKVDMDPNRPITSSRGDHFCNLHRQLQGSRVGLGCAADDVCAYIVSAS